MAYWLTVLVLGVGICPPAPPSSSSSRPASPTAPNGPTQDCSQASRSSSGLSRVDSGTKVPGCYNEGRGIPQIVLRKYYHLLAVIMFVPGCVHAPRLMALAFTGALSIFVVVEYFRIARVPPLGALLDDLMHAYVDKRDSGLAILTHTYLLVGCAAPLWLHVRAVENLPHLEQHDDGPKFWDDTEPERSRLSEILPALAGVVMLGIGDSVVCVHCSLIP